MDKLDLDFTRMEFHEGYVISHVKNDVILDVPQMQEMLDACKSHYGEQDFVYISNRKNNYNVNPIVYIKLRNTKTLLGLAIVCQSAEPCEMAEFEKKFSQKPFMIFKDMNVAIEWAEQMHKNKKAGL